MKKLEQSRHVLFIILIAFGCNNSSKSSIITPMIDGQIQEYIELGVQPIDLGDNVNLFLHQNEHYVWLAYSYPEGSYGILDMEIITPGLSDTLNIHVSAQLGEWNTKEGSPRPENPQSDLWWNHQGWYSNEVWPNGADRSGERARPKFKNAPCREIQLSKARFGQGTWYFHLNLGSIRKADGNFTRIEFPGESEFYVLDTKS